MSGTPARHFLGWEKPVADGVAAWLLERAERDAGALDLSGWWVIVPTVESGRTLVSALALARPDGFLAPRVMTPPQFLDALAGPRSERPVATGILEKAAWLATLAETSPEDVAALVLDGRLLAEPAGRKGLADLLARTRRALAESGLTFRLAAAMDGHEEPERWEVLARLEAAWTARLRAWGFTDQVESWIAAAKAGAAPPEGMKGVVFAACPDPLPVAVRAAGVAAAGAPFGAHVLVQAPEAEAPGFDEWGRAREEVWNGRALDWPDPEGTLRVALTEPEAAAHVADLARRHEDPAAMCVGVCREAMAGLALAALEAVGLQGFDPGGSLARAGGCRLLWSLLDETRTFAATGDIESVWRLARHPLAGPELRRKSGADDMAHAAWMACLEKARAHHLPGTVEELRDLAEAGSEAGRFARAASGLRAELGSERWAEALREWVRGAVDGGEGGEGGGFEPGPARDAAARVLLALREALEAAAAAGKAGGAAGISSIEWLDLAVEAAGDAAAPADRPEGAVELKGWLELGWEGAPHLVLAGFQEGAVPSAVWGDALLPEGLRRRLGLRTNEARAARDAYLLAAVRAARRENGRVDVVLSRFGEDGEPLKPSRLLARCADAELPARVELLFPEHVRPAAPPPPSAEPRLAFPEDRMGDRGKRISVSALGTYLACPFLYYLEHRAGWRETRLGRRELGADEFGSLAHEVAKDLGRDDASQLKREEDLRAYLVDGLRRRLSERFGKRLPVALEIQARSLEQRLAALAREEAALRAEGWRTEACEKTGEYRLGNGWVVTFRIDRVDRCKGKVRLLDYKTSETAGDPIQAHWGGLGGLAAGREFARVREGLATRPKRWTDLQLPLYVAAWARDNSKADERISCGYFNLPRAVGETGVMLWNGFESAVAADAVRCAEAATTEIENREFWPPEPQAWRGEAWDVWFGGDPAGCVIAPPQAGGNAG